MARQLNTTRALGAMDMHRTYSRLRSSNMLHGSENVAGCAVAVGSVAWTKQLCKFILVVW